MICRRAVKMKRVTYREWTNVRWWMFWSFLRLCYFLLCVWFAPSLPPSIFGWAHHPCANLVMMTRTEWCLWLLEDLVLTSELSHEKVFKNAPWIALFLWNLCFCEHISSPPGVCCLCAAPPLPDMGAFSYQVPVNSSGDSSMVERFGVFLCLSVRLLCK